MALQVENDFYEALPPCSIFDKMLSSLSLAVLVFLPLFQCSYALWPLNDLATTPQMGWDNWNAFGCDVSEDLLLGTAQKMVDYGLRDAGYHYVVLDDCWSAGRSENGTLQWNSTKFPNGMAYVADQLHGMGLKFGMYSDAVGDGASFTTRRVRS